MPTYCCVPNCKGKGGHMFPKDSHLRRQWIAAIKRDKWHLTATSIVCESHFRAEDYTEWTIYGYKPLRKSLKSSAVPSQFAWTPQPSTQALFRTTRLKTRCNKKGKKSCEVPYGEINNLNMDNELTVGLAVEVASEPTPSSSNQRTDTETQTVDETVQTAHASVQTLQKHSFTVVSIANNEKAVHFYTGLENYAKFQFVLASLGPASHSLTYMYGDVENIGIEDQFLMVLMKLRRYTTNFELGMMFGLCESQVYNVFCTWIRFMSLQWRELNLWPSRDLVNFFMPSDFRGKFPKTRVILDGTECPVKSPKLPLAQQAKLGYDVMSDLH